jgi:hypothetical protein
VRRIATKKGKAKPSCDSCKLNRSYDPDDPDASICIHYDCFAPEFKHFEEKLKDGEKK